MDGDENDMLNLGYALFGTIEVWKGYILMPEQMDQPLMVPFIFLDLPTHYTLAMTYFHNENYMGDYLQWLVVDIPLWR
jgi:hypothetical protein